MNKEFDLHSNRGESWNGFPTLEIHSHSKGPLAVLVDGNEPHLMMSIVSVVDHITEPRDVDDYSVESTGDLNSQINPVWDLVWTLRSGEKITLGQVTTEVGANNLLTYLKEVASNEN